MPDGDGTAVDVDLLRIDTEFLHRGQRDRRERLVDLDDVKLVDRDALPGNRLLDGIGRLGLQGGVRACDSAVRADLDQPGQPQLRRLSLLITTTAAAPSEIGDAEPAVMVPFLRKAGLSPANDSAVVSARMPSSLVNSSGSPLRCGIFTGTTSSAKTPSFHAAAAFWCDRAANSSCSARVN